MTVGRLQFLVDRTLRREGALMRLSVDQADLLSDAAGRTVAIVGNARSLAETTSGAAIDRADRVVRINRAPMPSPVSHGHRTDWLALAVRLHAADRERIAPGRVLWMSHKRKRLGYAEATSAGFYLHPLADWKRLGTELGAPPSTGAMVIDLLMRSEAERVDLYGFDFFASLSLTGSRTADRVPHDFDAERRWVERLAARDGRLTLPV